MPTLTMFIQNGIEKPRYSNQTEKKRNFENSNLERKKKKDLKLSVLADNMMLQCRKP